MIKNYQKLIKELMENVEVIDVKLNNRKTKKIGEKKKSRKKIIKIKKCFLNLTSKVKLKNANKIDKKFSQI